MAIKYCKSCNERMIEGLYPYENKEWEEHIDIDKMAGHKCFNCGIIEFDEDIEKDLEKDVELQKMLYQRKKGKDSPIYPIMISKVKNARVGQELTPKDMADVLGVTEQRFGSIERNNNTPNVYIALQLEKIMNVDIHDLYELVYIPSELHEKLKILNDKFEVIEGIPELLSRRDEIDLKLKELKGKLEDRRAEIKGEVESEIAEAKKKDSKKAVSSKDKREKISTRINEDDINSNISEEMKDLRNERIQVNKEIDRLTGQEKDEKGKGTKGKKNPKEGEVEKQNFLLRLGYCIDYDNWQKVQELYAAELIIK
jgi:DNA-binding XRE family transcriptional regulator